jgi:hypothetical protein
MAPKSAPGSRYVVTASTTQLRPNPPEAENEARTPYLIRCGECAVSATKGAKSKSN